MAQVYCISCYQVLKSKEAKKLPNGDWKCRECYQYDIPEIKQKSKDKARDKRPKRRTEYDDFDDDRDY